MDEYEIRAEHGPAKPGPNGAARRGEVHLWHICLLGSLTALCGHGLSPTADTLPIAMWTGTPPGDVSPTEHRRCQPCHLEYATAVQPPPLST